MTCLLCADRMAYQDSRGLLRGCQCVRGPVSVMEQKHGNGTPPRPKPENLKIPRSRWQEVIERCKSQKQCAVAAELGVSRATISRIVRKTSHCAN